MMCIFKDQSIDSSLGSVSSKLPLKSTVNAQISAPSPTPSPDKKRCSVLGTIYETYTVLLVNVTFVIVQK